MAGFVPKFQPSMTEIVGGVCVQRNKMATILYMYRFHRLMKLLTAYYKIFTNNEQLLTFATLKDSVSLEMDINGLKSYRG